MDEDFSAVGSRQLLEQLLRFFQVGGVKALGEPAIDGREEVASLGEAAPVAVKPGEVCGRAQFERAGLLALGDRQQLFEQFLRVGRHSRSAFNDQCVRPQAQELCFKYPLTGPLGRRQTLADDSRAGIS